MKEYHSLIRTSPKGTKFVGTCTRCGVACLTAEDMKVRCENVRSVTQGQALLEIIEDTDQ